MFYKLKIWWVELFTLLFLNYFKEVQIIYLLLICASLLYYLTYKIIKIILKKKLPLISHIFKTLLPTLLILFLVSIFVQELKSSYYLEKGVNNNDAQCLYLSDQTDRMNFPLYFLKEQIIKRDSIRLETANKIYSEIDTLDPYSAYYLGFIFHHGKDSLEYRKAYELFKYADKKKVSNSKFLKKAAYDRLMISKGKDQKYNTQF